MNRKIARNYKNIVKKYNITQLKDLKDYLVKQYSQNKKNYVLYDVTPEQRYETLKLIEENKTIRQQYHIVDKVLNKKLGIKG